MEKVVLSEEQMKKKEELKIIRHSLAWVHYKLGVSQFYFEEIKEAAQARGVLEAVCNDLHAQIIDIDPSEALKEEKKDEPKKPYVIDAGTVKA
jgi:hypothetical protein